MKKYFRVFEIYPGGWVILSILYFFADLDEFIIVIACVLVHEIGHLFVLECFAVPVRRITVTFTGLTIWYHESSLYGIRAFIAALAGPLSGLLMAVTCAFLGQLFPSERVYLFVGGNVVLSMFNLLPAKPLDGWRCLYALFPMIAQVTGVCTAIGVLVVGLYTMYAGYGTALAIMGIILLLQEVPEKRRKQLKISAW